MSLPVRIGIISGGSKLTFRDILNEKRVALLGQGSLGRSHHFVQRLNGGECLVSCRVAESMKNINTCYWGKCMQAAKKEVLMRSDARYQPAETREMVLASSDQTEAGLFLGFAREAQSSKSQIRDVTYGAQGWRKRVRGLRRK